jgi:hypothetical protein
VGAGLMPDNALSMHFLQKNIRTYSKLIDSTRSGNVLPVNIVGSLEDPTFGITKASFYSQIEPVTLGKRFGTNPQTDSLVLQLYYANVYGDTNATLRLHVYEMKDDISFDSIYFSSKNVAVYPTDYADFTFRPDQKRVYVLNNVDTIRNAIRVNLSNISKALGDKLLNTDTTALDSTELFLHYFKGLYLTADPVSGKGALVSFNTNTRRTILTVYYHNDEQDSLKYAFILDANMAKINHYDHDYSSAATDLKNQVFQNDTLLGQQRFYVQGLAGVETIIKFPHLRDLNKLGKVGVNEAKLVLPGAEKTPFYTPPQELSLIRIKNDTISTLLPDEEIEGADYFGGKYDASTNSYTFRITRYVESILKDSTYADNGLILFTKSGAYKPERFIFNGPEFQGDTTRRTRLDILYTIVK